MKILLTLIFIISIFGFGSSQTLEEATLYFKQDSIDKAVLVLNQLDQSDKKVIKLGKKIKRYQKQALFEQEVENNQSKRIYGGIPSSNPNLKWEDNLTPNEKYTGVIHVDSTVKANEIIEAFIATFQPMQDANIMTRQMRNNSMIGSVSSSLSGDFRTANDFAESGSADTRLQNGSKSVWNVQFIDGVRMYRFYYNVNVQAKDGRYKITIIPSGTSGYAQDHVQKEWSQLFSNGEVRSLNTNYHKEIKIKLALTLDNWTKAVNDYLIENATDDW